MPDLTEDVKAEPAPEMSTKAMVLLGTAMSVGVALILGVTLLIGGGDTTAKQPAGLGAPGTVPVVKGLTLSKATSALAERKLAVGAVIQAPSTLPAGQVDHTSPTIGTPVSEGSPIILYVSGGGKADGKVAVPYLIGLDAMQAQTVSGQLGLRLTLPGTSGKVLEQNPKAGTEVDRGTVVRVTLQ